MKSRKNLILSVIIIMIFNAMLISAMQGTRAATVYKSGSRGEVVRQIQQKLKDWGYYKGSVDGIYGEQTTAAVKSFQSKNGLKSDGVVGEQTLKALGINANQPGGGGGGDASKTNDLYLLSRIISAEGRGEPYNGQIAIGAVIMNRIRHPSFPNTLAGVIYQPGAFSAIDDGQFDQPIAEVSRKAAQEVLNGVNPVGDAIYYYNPKTATNKWIRSRPIIKVIGKHVFCT